MQYRLSGGARVLVATFTLDGFYRLFRVPADRLTPAAFTDPDTLAAAGSFARLAAQLLGLLPLLTTHPHLNPLRAMAAASRLSERTWQLRFRKYLGFSAKEAARFLRFRQVVEHLR